MIRILTNFLSHDFDCLYFHVKTESYSIVGKQAANLKTKSVFFFFFHLLLLIERHSANSKKLCDIPIMTLLDVVGLILLKLAIISRVTNCKLGVFESG